MLNISNVDFTKKNVNVDNFNSFQFFEHPHQVGGRVPVITDHKGQVAKPYYGKEIEIYEFINNQLPQQYSHFFCPYKGFIDIPLDKLKNLNDNTNNSCNDQKDEVIKQDQINIQEINNSTSDLNKESDENNNNMDEYYYIDSNIKSLSTAPYIPQTKQMLNELWEKLFDSSRRKMRTDEFGRCRFILMDDLTFRYSKPCVLDIKMGTYKLYRNTKLESILSQLQKCRKTTSGSLGLRIIGLKGFKTENNTTGSYFTKDRSWGKTITPMNIKQNLSLFFESGNGIRYSIVTSFLQKVIEIRNMISSVPIEFIGSSLLLVYDADDKSTPKVNLKIIDFSKCNVINDGSQLNKGFILGLDSLISLLTLISNE